MPRDFITKGIGSFITKSCRMNASFDLKRYRSWQQSHKETCNPDRLSFQQVMEMVSKGIPIPGIKKIPDITHGYSSQPTMAPIKKPWETAPLILETTTINGNQDLEINSSISDVDTEL